MPIAQISGAVSDFKGFSQEELKQAKKAIIGNAKAIGGKQGAALAATLWQQLQVLYSERIDTHNKRRSARKQGSEASVA